jgi:hypothetical protein
LVHQILINIKKLFMKKNWSILGVLLVAASAVTAAVVPAAKNDKVDPELLPSATASNTGATLTCQITLTENDGRQICDISQSFTTNVDGQSEDNNGVDTE